MRYLKEKLSYNHKVCQRFLADLFFYLIRKMYRSMHKSTQLSIVLIFFFFHNWFTISILWRNFLRKIWYIFKRDLKAVFRNPVAAVIAVGIMILPSLYAWFNIAANWDPYGNTGELKVAVVNEDEGLDIESMDLPDTARCV